MTEEIFRGGMSLQVSGRWVRRFNASMPFAKFQFSEFGISLGTRTRNLPDDLQSVTCKRAEVKGVFRTTGPGFGLGFDTVDGKTHYFWTFQRRRIPVKLKACGYTVSEDRHPRWLFLQTFPLFPRDRSQAPHQ